MNVYCDSEASMEDILRTIQNKSKDVTENDWPFVISIQFSSKVLLNTFKGMLKETQIEINEGVKKPFKFKLFV